MNDTEWEYWYEKASVLYPQIKNAVLGNDPEERYGEEVDHLSNVLMRFVKRLEDESRAPIEKPLAYLARCLTNELRLRRRQLLSSSKRNSSNNSSPIPDTELPDKRSNNVPQCNAILQHIEDTKRGSMRHVARLLRLCDIDPKKKYDRQWIYRILGMSSGALGTAIHRLKKECLKAPEDLKDLGVPLEEILAGVYACHLKEAKHDYASVPHGIEAAAYTCYLRIQECYFKEDCSAEELVASATAHALKVIRFMMNIMPQGYESSDLYSLYTNFVTASTFDIERKPRFLTSEEDIEGMLEPNGMQLVRDACNYTFGNDSFSARDRGACTVVAFLLLNVALVTAKYWLTQWGVQKDANLFDPYPNGLPWCKADLLRIPLEMANSALRLSELSEVVTLVYAADTTALRIVLKYEKESCDDERLDVMSHGLMQFLRLRKNIKLWHRGWADGVEHSKETMSEFRDAYKSLIAL